MLPHRDEPEFYTPIPWVNSKKRKATTPAKPTTAKKAAKSNKKKGTTEPKKSTPKSASSTDKGLGSTEEQKDETPNPTKLNLTNKLDV